MLRTSPGGEGGSSYRTPAANRSDCRRNVGGVVAIAHRVADVLPSNIASSSYSRPVRGRAATGSSAIIGTHTHTHTHTHTQSVSVVLLLANY